MIDIDVYLVVRDRGDVRRLLFNLIRGGSLAVRAPASEHPRGAGRDRTDDLRLAKPALSQLSYSPLLLEGS
jgi:hypothetical protein